MADPSQPGDPAAQSPSRPRRGLPLEVAIKHWSDPDAYAAMAELADASTPVSMSPGAPPSPSFLRHQAYRALRGPLEAAFLEKLRAAELIVSATDERPSAANARFVVDPETFERLGFLFDMPDAMAGRGGGIYNIEVFEPHAIPTNIGWLPDWLEEMAAELNGATPTALLADDGLADRPVPASFRHDVPYRHVWLHGEEFSLTAKQALVVEALHEAALAGEPWVHASDLLYAAESDSDKLTHLFRRFKDPHWSALIRSDGRGCYRLNVASEG